MSPVERLNDWMKLKWVWFTLAACIVFILSRQGWPSPAFEDFMIALNQAQIGALLGFGLDTVHFHYAKPTSNDKDTQNMWRRTVFIVGGMLAVSLA